MESHTESAALLNIGLTHCHSIEHLLNLGVLSTCATLIKEGPNKYLLLSNLKNNFGLSYVVKKNVHSNMPFYL